ncbi:MAG: hypothetical protein ACYTG1_01635 [Planctomycetota bacterium]
MGQLTLTELQAELSRRVENLHRQRDELLKKLEEIDNELETVGGIDAAQLIQGASSVNGGGVRRRGRNARPLREYLVEVLADSPRTTREAADAVLEMGYATSSKNFVNNVGVVLHKDEQFSKHEGRWRVAANGTEASGDDDD